MSKLKGAVGTRCPNREWSWPSRWAVSLTEYWRCTWQKKTRSVCKAPKTALGFTYLLEVLTELCKAQSCGL